MTPLQGALKLYDLGYRVFPVISNGKEPLNTGWQYWAETADIERIRRYKGSCNWGVSCASQLAVIDLDVKHGHDGVASLKRIEAEHQPLPKTLTVQTPSGGFHLYYSGQIPSTTGTIADGIDTKSETGYVLAPGSTIGGKEYKITHDRPIVQLPKWFSGNGFFNKEKSKLDKPSDDKVKGSIPQTTRNATVYKWASSARGMGFTKEEFAPSIHKLNEIRCNPPLSTAEVDIIISQAAKYSTNEAKAIADFSVVADVDSMKKESDWPIPLDDLTQGKAPRREWVIPEWLPQGEISSLYGQGSTGKSLLTLQMGLSIASGTKFLGVDIENRMPFIGIYCEDSKNEVWRRLDDIRDAPEYAFSKREEYVTWPRVGKDNALVMASGDNVVPGPFMAKLRAYLSSLDKRPRFMVLDTLSDIYMGDENTREKVNKVIKVHIAALAAEFSLTVMLLAHPSRSGMGTGDMLSGSTAWENAVRNRLALVGENDVMALKRLKSNYARKDDEGIKFTWNKGRFIELSYGKKETLEGIELGRFLAGWCGGGTGATPIDKNMTLQLTTDPSFGHLINSTKVHLRQQEKLIRILKRGVPNTKDTVFKYELRATKQKHWIVWKHKVDLLS